MSTHPSQSYEEDEVKCGIYSHLSLSIASMSREKERLSGKNHDLEK